METDKALRYLTKYCNSSYLFLNTVDNSGFGPTTARILSLTHMILFNRRYSRVVMSASSETNTDDLLYMKQVCAEVLLNDNLECKHWKETDCNKPLERAYMYQKLQNTVLTSAHNNPKNVSSSNIISKQLSIDDDSHKCSAVYLDNMNMNMKWIKIDCDDSMKSALVICKKSVVQRNRSERSHDRPSQYFCPSRWLYIGGHCYRMVSVLQDGMSCHSIGGKLANITTSKHGLIFKLKSYILRKLLSSSTDNFLAAGSDGRQCVNFYWLNSRQDWVAEAASCLGNTNNTDNVLCEHDKDFIPATCYPGQFTCSDKTCVLNRYVCDGYINFVS